MRKSIYMTVLGLLAALACLTGVLFVFNASEQPSSGTQPAASSSAPETTARQAGVSESAPKGTAVVVQLLPSECEQAVAPIRELMLRYPNGYKLDVTGGDLLNKALGAARKACPSADWKRFNDLEFLGWFSPAKP